MAEALLSILKTLLTQPTAPFHEYHVRAAVEEQLLDVPHVEMGNDAFGNLIATYRKGRRAAKPVWVLCAHMDHPAWVRTPGKNGDWDFLGGLPKSLVERKETRELKREAGEIAPFGFQVKIADGRVEAPACDDLVGCAIIVSAIREISRLGIETTFHAAFTRAEEVGLLGAWHLGKHWPFGKEAVFLSIENSRPVNGAEIGDGPIIRVGDKLSVFDHELVELLMRTAAEQGIRVQRALLDAGACEASALQACGIRSAGVSVPLGNYHNIGEDESAAPEYVMLDDVRALVKLLVALVGTEHTGLGERSLEERVALRTKEYRKHLEAGNARFEAMSA